MLIRGDFTCANRDMPPTDRVEQRSAFCGVRLERLLGITMQVARGSHRALTSRSRSFASGKLTTRCPTHVRIAAGKWHHANCEQSPAIRQIVRDFDFLDVAS